MPIMKNMVERDVTVHVVDKKTKANVALVFPAKSETEISDEQFEAIRSDTFGKAILENRWVLPKKPEAKAEKAEK